MSVSPGSIQALLRQRLMRRQPHLAVWLETQGLAMPGDAAEVAALHTVLASHQEPEAQALRGALPAPERIQIGSWQLLFQQGQAATGARWYVRSAADSRGALAILHEVAQPRQADPAALNAWRQARHPNLLTCLDIGHEVSGAGYLVTECWEGLDLQDLVEEQGPLLETDALRIAYQIADAVAVVHQSTAVHGCLHPNYVWTIDADMSTLVGGCGLLTQLLRASQVTDLGGAILDVVPFLAPEQLRGEPLTPLVDIHAIGQLLFHLLAGRPARLGPLPGLSEQIERGEQVSIRSLRPTINRDVEAIVMAACQPLASDRPASTGALKGLIASALCERGADPGNVVADQTAIQSASVWGREALSSAHSLADLTLAVPMAAPGPDAVPMTTSRPDAVPMTTSRPDAVPLLGDLAEAWQARSVALEPLTGPASDPLLLFAGPDLMFGKHRTDSVDVILRLYPIADNGPAWQRISRQHAVLRCTPDELLIYDLGSSNGTQVDGILLRPHDPLRMAADRASEINIAGSLLLCATPRPVDEAHRLPSGVSLAAHQQGWLRAVSIQRQYNRSGLMMALVPQAVTIGNQDSPADLPVLGLIEGRSLCLGQVADRWLLREAAGWRPLSEGEPLTIGPQTWRLAALRPEHFGL